MGKDSTYETFDSAGGPTIPESAEAESAHNDDGKGGVEVTQGAVPTMPQSKE